MVDFLKMHTENVIKFNFLKHFSFISNILKQRYIVGPRLSDRDFESRNDDNDIHRNTNNDFGNDISIENDNIVNVCLNGDKKSLNKTFRENNFFLEDFFILLKILSKKIHRLLKIKILNRSKKNIDQIFNQIKPPIFWKEKEDVKKQIKLWNEKKLNLTIMKINEIELNCKKNHELATTITLDFLSTVCNEVNNYS